MYVYIYVCVCISDHIISCHAISIFYTHRNSFVDMCPCNVLIYGIPIGPFGEILLGVLLMEPNTFFLGRKINTELLKRSLGYPLVIFT